MFRPAEQNTARGQITGRRWGARRGFRVSEPALPGQPASPSRAREFPNVRQRAALRPGDNLRSSNNYCRPLFGETDTKPRAANSDLHRPAEPLMLIRSPALQRGTGSDGRPSLVYCASRSRSARICASFDMAAGLARGCQWQYDSRLVRPERGMCPWCRQQPDQSPWSMTLL